MNDASFHLIHQYLILSIITSLKSPLFCRIDHKYLNLSTLSSRSPIIRITCLPPSDRCTLFPRLKSNPIYTFLSQLILHLFPCNAYIYSYSLLYFLQTISNQQANVLLSRMTIKVFNFHLSRVTIF